MDHNTHDTASKRIYAEDILVKNFLENKEYKEKFGLRKYVCKLLVESMMHTIRTRLGNGQTVVLPTVGRLIVNKVPPRRYSNPRTGKIEVASARLHVVFKPSSRLQKILEKSTAN